MCKVEDRSIVTIRAVAPHKIVWRSDPSEGYSDSYLSIVYSNRIFNTLGTRSTMSTGIPSNVTRLVIVILVNLFNNCTLWSISRNLS